MLLTAQQLHDIKEIIRNHHSAFVVNYLGPESVPQDVLDKLAAMGLVNIKINSIEDAYLLGHVVAGMENPAVKNMSYDELKAHLKKNPIPLSQIEQQAIDFATLHAGEFVHGLGNKVGATVGSALIEADAALRAQLVDEIQTQTAENIAKRQSVKKLKSELGHATGDWARDWDRIAITEKHNAMQRGTADSYRKRYGGEVRVFKRPMPDACKHCKRLHLGTDGQPLIFKLSDLEANGTNYGRKVADWLPTVGAVHPHCQCQLGRVPEGWGFNEEGDLVPGGTLGQAYQSMEDFELALKEQDDLVKAFKLQGHTQFQGLQIAIENKKGTYRKWKDAEGNEGQTLMPYAYGYVKGTTGADEDEHDVFIGPNPRATKVYVIHQQNPSVGTYDEDKSMLGFDSAEQAKQAYLEAYDKKGPEFLVTVSEMDIGHFKRWLAETAPQDGPLKHVIPIPLKKAVTGMPAEYAAQWGHAAARNPGPGTVFNYIANVPERNVSRDHAGYRQMVLQDHAEIRHGMEAMKRDINADYEVTEKQDIPPKTFVIPVGYHDGKEDEPEETRKWLTEYQEGGLTEEAKNYADIEDASVEPSQPLQKALYLGPHGGKWANPQHTIPWKPETAQKPKKAQQPSFRGYKTRSVESLQKPHTAKWLMQAGSSVQIVGGESGTMVGNNWDGQPVIKTASGKILGLKQKKGDPPDIGWGSKDNPTLLKKDNKPYRSVAEHLSKGAKILDPKPEQKQLFDRALALTVTGKHTAKEYMDHLRDFGNEVFLVGGIVRDCLAGTYAKQSPNATFEAMKDVDIVTTAHPGIAKRAQKAVTGKEFDGSNKKRFRDNAKWGVVQILDGAGLDVATIASREGNPMAKYGGVGDHDLHDDTSRRDFTCNALYYDVHNDVIIDPTGQGVADAETKTLRLAPTPEQAKANKSLPVRFWKFRTRGYGTDPNDKVTLPLMRQMMIDLGTNYPSVLMGEMLKVFSKPGMDKKATWAKLKQSMYEDGAGDLYKKFLSPIKKAVRDG